MDFAYLGWILGCNILGYLVFLQFSSIEVLFAYDFAALYYNLIKLEIFVKFYLLAQKNPFIDFSLF
jgi:hypothetical protein